MRRRMEFEITSPLNFGEDMVLNLLEYEKKDFLDFCRGGMIMNIETDLVKGKKFSSPINSGIQKHSQEYKVLAILRYLYPQKFSTMINGEAPDLQDSENGVGIEVVSAAQQDDMRASRAFSELHQTKGVNDEKNEERIRASGYKFVPVQGNIVGISTTGTSDGEKMLVQKIVLKKAEKIQQYKKNFRKVGLAILFSETPTSYTEDHCLEWVTEVLNQFQDSFDFVYVLSHRFCIYYEIQKKISEKRCFTENVYESLSTIARMTAEGELSLTDLEWL